MFDMTLDDRIDDVQEDIEDNLENHAHNLKQQHQQMVDFVKRHLYQHATPGPLDFAHEQATSSKSSSSKNVPHLAQAPPPQAPPANAEIPTHEPSPPTNVKTMAKERQRAKPVGPNTKSPAQKQPEGMDGPASVPVPEAAGWRRAASKGRNTSPVIVQTEEGKKRSIAAHWKHGRRSKSFVLARKKIWDDLRQKERQMKSEGII